MKIYQKSILNVEFEINLAKHCPHKHLKQKMFRILSLYYVHSKVRLAKPLKFYQAVNLTFHALTIPFFY